MSDGDLSYNAFEHLPKINLPSWNDRQHFLRRNQDGSLQLTEHKRIVDSEFPGWLKAGGTAFAGSLTNHIIKPVMEASQKALPIGAPAAAAAAVAAAALGSFSALNYKIVDDRGSTAALSAPDYPNGNRDE